LSFEKICPVATVRTRTPPTNAPIATRKDKQERLLLLLLLLLGTIISFVVVVFFFFCSIILFLFKEKRLATCQRLFF